MMLLLLDIRIRRLMSCCGSVVWMVRNMVAVLILAVVYYCYCIGLVMKVISCDLLGLLRMVVEARELFRLPGIRLGMARNSC